MLTLHLVTILLLVCVVDLGSSGPFVGGNHGEQMYLLSEIEAPASFVF